MIYWRLRRMVFVPARRKAEKTQKESGKSRVNFRVIARLRSLPELFSRASRKSGGNSAWKKKQHVKQGLNDFIFYVASSEKSYRIMVMAQRLWWTKRSGPSAMCLLFCFLQRFDGFGTLWPLEAIFAIKTVRHLRNSVESAQSKIKFEVFWGWKSIRSVEFESSRAQTRRDKKERLKTCWENPKAMFAMTVLRCEKEDCKSSARAKK